MPGERPTLDRSLREVGGHLLRYGLAGIVLWFGAFKFTAAEAAAIEPLLRNSPFLGWLYGVLSVEGASRLIGSVEVAIAVLIALRPVSASLSALGSLAAIGMFLTTLSFLATTPGMWVWVEGLLVPSSDGAFLIKDVFLLAAACWTAGDALSSTRRSGQWSPARA